MDRRSSNVDSRIPHVKTAPHSGHAVNEEFASKTALPPPPPPPPAVILPSNPTPTSAHQRLQGAESAAGHRVHLPLDEAFAKRRSITSAPPVSGHHVPTSSDDKLADSGAVSGQRKLSADTGPLVFSTSILERYGIRDASRSSEVAGGAQRPPHTGFAYRGSTATRHQRDSVLPQIRISAYQRHASESHPGVVQPARRPAKVMAW